MNKKETLTSWLKDGSATGKFTQKRNGLKRWKPEELKRLEEIRRELVEVLRPD